MEPTENRPPDQTAGSEFIAKADARDKLVRGIELVILLVVVVFNIFLGLRIQRVIDQNGEQAEQRSQSAQADRAEQKAYIKCIVLLKFDATPEALANRDGLEKALDTCARQTESK